MPEPLLVRLRTKLGFSALEVAAAGGWSRKEFSEMEKSGELDTSDAIRLTDLYGVDIGASLTHDRIKNDSLPVAALLKGNAEVLTADARFAMTEAVSVSRDITEVKKALNLKSRVPVTSFKEDKDLSHPETGNVERLARKVRQKLGLNGIVSSVVTDICEPLGINIFVAEFNDQAVDAFSGWSNETGAFIVVNGKGRTAASTLGIRTTLAHEIVHLLFDRDKMRQIVTFCEIGQPSLSSLSERIEQRARAFQAELLAPKADVFAQWQVKKHEDYATGIAALVETFGVGPEAVAWQLANAGGPAYKKVYVSPTIDSPWVEWKLLLGGKPSALEIKVPYMRRRVLLKLVKEAVLGEQLSTSWSRELLRLDAADWTDLQTSWI